MQLRYCHFAQASKNWIIKGFKLYDRIKLLDTATSTSNNDQFFSDSKANNRERSKPDVDTYIISAPLSKIIKSIEDFCDIYIKKVNIEGL